MRAGERKSWTMCPTCPSGRISELSMSAKKPVPDWLRRHLIETGVWSADGINRRAALRRHPCGQLVLTGLDADACAWPTTVDIQKLTPLGEALAVLGGRHTYDYRPVVSELDGPRRAMRITWAPATDAGSVRVLAAHVCNAPPLPHFPEQPSRAKEQHAQPPY